MLSRREHIEAMLADDPGDTFLRYSLAMECDKEGENARSLDLLRGLMCDATPYVPAFFMAGQQLARLDRVDEACDAITAGIAAADQQGNTHAAGEMREFLAGL